MERKYTVKELESLINLSHTAIRNKIAEGEFKTSKEIVNKRRVTLVKFPEKDWKNLVLAYGYRDDSQATENNFKQVDRQPEAIEATIVKDNDREPYEDLEENKTSLNISELLDKFNQVHREYREELLNMNKKLVLLEDSERRKEQSYLQLQAHNQQLKKQLEETSDRLKEVESTLKEKEKHFLMTPVNQLIRKI